ncbi:MAG: hypothetical protein JXB39_12580 [Deltaproteobacteria bacterium]|nr:hypothetical protein [Deltaproteobacteria bacterium]
MTPHMVLALWLAPACAPEGDSGPAGADTGHRPATWSADVHPILTTSCQGCHQGAMPMALTGDPASDYDVVVPYTNVADPERSTLYEAATGLAHASVLAEGSEAAQAFVSWMAAGARED